MITSSVASFLRFKITFNFKKGVQDLTHFKSINFHIYPKIKIKTHFFGLELVKITIL